MFKKLITFGEMKAKNIVEYIFGTGFIISIYSSYLLGKFLYSTSTYIKDVSYIQNGTKWFTGQEVNNLPLGIIGFIVSLVISVFVWKIICEILYLIIRCMEIYLDKNKNH